MINSPTANIYFILLQGVIKVDTNPERHLQVFPTPDVHSFIIGANFIEIVPVNGKQPSGHGGGPEGKKIYISVQ